MKNVGKLWWACADRRHSVAAVLEERLRYRFGYSGRSERLNHRTFRVWGEILARLPTAKLVLDFRNLSDPHNQMQFRALMRAHGMDTDRVVMRNSSNIFQGSHDFDLPQGVAPSALSVRPQAQVAA
jgi:hypothetical protein